MISIYFEMNMNGPSISPRDKKVDGPAIFVMNLTGHYKQIGTRDAEKGRGAMIMSVP